MHIERDQRRKVKGINFMSYILGNKSIEGSKRPMCTPLFHKKRNTVFALNFIPSSKGKRVKRPMDSKERE